MKRERSTAPWQCGCAALILAVAAIGCEFEPAKSPNAKALGMRACTKAEPRIGCLAASKAALDGKMTQAKLTESLQLAAMSCQAGAMAACGLVGLAFDRAGDDMSASRGLVFHLRACYFDEKEAESCKSFEAAVQVAVD